MEALRAVLEPWLGEPRWKRSEGRVTFVYRFVSEDTPPVPLKLRDPQFAADITPLLAADAA